MVLPGGFSYRPPGTVFPRKRVRCPFLPSPWHGFPARVFQVASPCLPPGTVFPRKRSRCHFPPSHLARNSRESVPGSFSYRPPGTVFLQKCTRCLFSAVHLARNSCESVPGSFSYRPPGTVFLQKCSRCLFPLSTWHGIPAKAFQVAFPAVPLPRFSCESVPGVSSCRPPGTESPRKCTRCLFLPSTWHGIPAKACQVAPLAVHLARFLCKSVPGVFPRCPPGTESPRKRFR